MIARTDSDCGCDEDDIEGIAHVIAVTGQGVLDKLFEIQEDLEVWCIISQKNRAPVD